MESTAQYGARVEALERYWQPRRQQRRAQGRRAPCIWRRLSRPRAAWAEERFPDAERLVKG